MKPEEGAEERRPAGAGRSTNLASSWLMEKCWLELVLRGADDESGADRGPARALATV